MRTGQVVHHRIDVLLSQLCHRRRHRRGKALAGSGQVSPQADAQIFGLLAGNAAGAIFGLGAITILFALVTLHELGHTFAAQHYGIEVKQIVLSPLGGVAQLHEMPDRPTQELVIAAAGPAVNFAVAGVMVVGGGGGGTFCY